MKLAYALTLLSFVGLAACQVQREVVKEIHDASPAPTSQAQHQGGVDGGGGNGVDGKPIESYEIRLDTLDEYQNEVAAVIAKLKTAFPQLAADFTYLTRARAWYLIPVSLNRLPSIAIGASFPTDQLAFQTKGSVWIDARQFAKMEREGRVRLILHELLMGVRILDQLGALENCLARAEMISDGADYRAARKICYNNYKLGSDVNDAFRASPKLEVSQSDYDLIRSTVNLLLRGDVDGEDLRGLFAAKKFRVYEN